ncbi:acyltransferase [Herbaspirillum sp. SJZ107]|uniref:acyltransferase family protein n=1 Tax=Herbaspirillum sp. SJZ107 TaxID=2572881 RepID=UPI00117129AB|nr:acyltransferase [Herbaspirillum sp. SJZ107]TQK10376.1 acyltransferase-like protein [Herbaspirillum sp. SJZ107]
MTTAFDASIAKRISMLRTILIMLVVLLHIGTPALGQLDYGNTYELIRFFFQDELGRLSVPTLTAISGYLLFSSKLDLAPAKLYKKKLRTILVPFFFFNIVYYAVQYAIEYCTGWAPLYLLVGKPGLDSFNYIFSYSGFPLNFALHFLRDLFILVLMAPLFGYAIRRRPWLGLMLLALVFMSDADGHLVNRNTMAVLFYIGGMAAAGNWNLKRFDRLAIPALGMLVAVCIATIYYRIEDYVYIYLTAPIAVWPASSLLLNTQPGRWAEKYSKYSFFLFLTHVPLIHVVDMFCAHNGLDAGAYTIPTFLFLVAFVPFAYHAALYVMPGTFSFLIGGRVKAAKPASAQETAGGMLARA